MNAPQRGAYEAASPEERKLAFDRAVDQMGLRVIEGAIALFGAMDVIGSLLLLNRYRGTAGEPTGT